MRVLLTATALVCALAASAAAETRSLSGFTSVSASAGIDVDVAVGAFRVDVTGPDAEYIVTRVVGGELQIERRSHWGWGNSHRNARVHVTMPRVVGLEASSGAHITAAALQADDISLEASSGADLTVAGACRSVNADSSSGAHVNAAALHCQSGSVDASSGSRSDVNVSGALNVDASSGGDVYANSGAQIGNVSLSSGGSLHRS